MDLIVELPDGTTKLVPVSLNCSVRAATQSTILRAGMAPIASKLTEFSLAKKTDNSNPLVNVCWLEESLRVKDQGGGGGGGGDGSLHLILLKKYFSVNTDLTLLTSNDALLKNIYAQFRLAYVSGLYRCTQSEAAQLSALIARAEFSLSELRPGSLQKTGRLEGILPSFHLNSSDMEQKILKALGTVAHLTETKAQEQFIELVRNSATFGLSMHTITLVQIGGEKREALLGVGPQHITVMEAHNLQQLMQWKTQDLTEHSYNDTTLTMTCGSETVTVVTKQGHMISAFIMGMSSSSPSNKTPGKKPPVAQRKSHEIIENGHSEDGMYDRAYSTHIKSVGKQVEKYEVKMHKTGHPVVSPRPALRRAEDRPIKPLKPKHVALHGTKSVPIQPRSNPSHPISSIVPKTGVVSRDIHNRCSVYEVPVQRKQKKAPPPLPKWEEARYETNNVIEEESLPPTTTKVRPLRPPPLLAQQLLKKKPLPSTNTGKDSKTEVFLKKIHKSESDVTQLNEDERVEFPIYDELVQPPEYAEPDAHSPSMIRNKKEKYTAFKRKSQMSTPNLANSIPSSNPLSSPPPSSPAPPPPSTERVQRTNTSQTPPLSRSPAPPSPAPPPPSETISPQTNTSIAPPPPRIPAPEPPIYDTLTPEDDIIEIEAIFGSKDLPMQVKYSCDANPIYNTLAATKVNTSLSTSDTTYHSFTSTLEKRKKRKPKPYKKTTNQPTISSPTPSSASSTSPPHDYENSELLSLLMKDIPVQSSSHGSESTTVSNEPRPRKKTPSPPLKRGPQIVNGSKANEKTPRHLAVSNGTPSYGYSRLEHFKVTKTKVLPQPQTTVEPNDSGTTNDDECLEHEYAEVDHNAPRKAKGGQKKQNAFEKPGWMMVQNGSPTPPPVPPMRGTEVKIGPPKPPRARQRWEKKVIKEGKSHKPIKNNDALRDYSTLMHEFRMFPVKLPTGIIHTELANIKSEVGKLVKRLCVLLCVDKADHNHYSLYVEGSPFTHLSEMLDEEEEGGMFRRLRQKSPSRQDLFGKSFAVLSERSSNPILLDPSLSFKSQGITTTRILALRPQTVLSSKLTRFQIRVPDWVLFHQCWLSVVQGNLISTQTEAIKLAALQYQAYFLDRTDVNSVIGFCRSSDFLPADCANGKGIEEKVFAEQQILKGYTRLHAQDSYIFTACSLSTYNTIFFHCMEAKRKRLRIQNTKLVSVMIGLSKEGVVRADFKTKEILDVWPYQVLKNWGYTDQTFILEFDDRTYPLKTVQGRWMNALVDFYIESIIGDMTTPPVTHQEMGEPNAMDEVVPIFHSRDNVDEIYSDLLSVREQAQQWLADNNKPSSPPTSPPTPHSLQVPSSATLSPTHIHATSVTTKYETSDTGAEYEEVSVDPTPRTVAFYDVLRKADNTHHYDDENDAIYDLPSDS